MLALSRARCALGPSLLPVLVSREQVGTATRGSVKLWRRRVVVLLQHHALRALALHLHEAVSSVIAERLQLCWRVLRHMHRQVLHVLVWRHVHRWLRVRQRVVPGTLLVERILVLVKAVNPSPRLQKRGAEVVVDLGLAQAACGIRRSHIVARHGMLGAAHVIECHEPGCAYGGYGCLVPRARERRRRQCQWLAAAWRRQLAWANSVGLERYRRDRAFHVLPYEGHDCGCCSFLPVLSVLADVIHRTPSCNGARWRWSCCRQRRAAPSGNFDPQCVYGLKRAAVLALLELLAVLVPSELEVDPALFRRARAHLHTVTTPS